jgi:HPt (histidine-containing phosphotransfer) domain-containing protein
MALFRQDAPPLLRTIQVAVSAGDGAAVHAGAHKLKGMLLNVAASRAAQIAGDLEGAARAGARDQLPALGAHLHVEVERLCESLASYNRSAA